MLLATSEKTSHYWDEGRGFLPIGNVFVPFTGTFDGLGNGISGLFINYSNMDYVGLFSFIGPGGTVKNVVINDVNVSGRDKVGSLIGENRGNVEFCLSTGNISGSGSIGGLIGVNNGNIKTSQATVNVNSYGGSYIGGLVGINYNKITKSQAYGDVYGSIDVGGLTGKNWGPITYSSASGQVVAESSVGGLIGSNGVLGTISQSYATGEVIGHSNVGGLVGINEAFNPAFGTGFESYASGNVIGNHSIGGLIGRNEGTFTKSYASGNVDGDLYVGGLVGLNVGLISQTHANGKVTGDENFVGGLVGWNVEYIERSYSNGEVICDGESVGGLVGLNDGIVTHSYWDTDTSRIINSSGGNGRNTDQMMRETTYVNWDFNELWWIAEGATRPLLQCMTESPITESQPNLDYSYQPFAGPNIIFGGWGIESNASFLTINNETGFIKNNAPLELGWYNVNIWADTDDGTRVWQNYTLSIVTAIGGNDPIDDVETNICSAVIVILGVGVFAIPPIISRRNY